MGNATHINTPILVTGCQRSGTTLVSLILDSHPMVTSRDEMQFDTHHLSDYLTNSNFHPYILLKLPTVAHEVNRIRKLRGIKVIWCIRDPRDTVLSMINLKRGTNRTEPWVTHPLGGMREIQCCANIVGLNLSAYHLDLFNRYMAIVRNAPQLSTSDAVYSGALCWRLKNELLELYDLLEIDCKILRFESLIKDPKRVIADLLNFIGAPWDDKVLTHHLLHKGVSVGNTDNTKPIDSTVAGKWKKELSEDNIKIIKSICSEIAKNHRYEL